MVALLLVVFLCFEIHCFQSARILAVLPIPYFSHQVFYRPLTQELAKRGHKVTVITTDPAFPKGNTPSNLIEIDIHNFSYSFYRNHFGKNVPLTDLAAVYKLMPTKLKTLMKTQELQEIITKKNEKFDLLLLPGIIPITIILTHIFKIPAIQISSNGAYDFNNKLMGSSYHPLLYPNILSKKAYKPTIFDLVKSKYNDWLIESAALDLNELNEVQQQYGYDIVSLNELQNNIKMLFLNIYPMWMNNQPLPPSMLLIGGLHKQPLQNISENLQTYLGGSKNGVIYFSFGSHMKPSVISMEKILMFIKVFSKLPYDVIWKWDQDELPQKSDNIKIFKWLPQPELLKHPNVKLFITQCGIQSTDEAISAGVPLIGIPMMTDQWYNADNYLHHKIGMKLELFSLTEHELKSAIETVITNQSYRENVIKLRTLMKDQRYSALDRAVWWTEYVLRHGDATHLRPVGANMSFTEYFELDLILIIAAIFIFFLIIVYFTINNLCKFLMRYKCLLFMSIEK